MNEPLSEKTPSDPADAPTPEQVAVLQYLGLAPAEGLISSQAGALISQSEADPANQEKLATWHREKHRLCPDLFAPAQRSYREARWWQARIADGSLYGYSLRQPSLDQTFVILESLDRLEPDWEREGIKRRETRFMNELATLSPELCKPGCAFPHDLPEEDPSEDETPVVPAKNAPSVPSAPFLPNRYAAGAPTFTPPSKPAWQPPVQPPAPPLAPDRETSAARGGGAWKWVALAAVLAAGAGAYFVYGFHPPALERGGGVAPSSSADPSAPVAATASRQRAVAKYPELARAGSPFNAKFLAVFHQLESEHDPLLRQPDWPERLAARCAGDAALHPTPASP